MSFRGFESFDPLRHAIFENGEIILLEAGEWAISPVCDSYIQKHEMGGAAELRVDC